VTDEQQTQAIAVIDDHMGSLPVQASKQARERIAAMRLYAEKELVRDVHYGQVPGVPKPFLWKTGAEDLNSAWMVRPRFTVEDKIIDIGQQVFFYKVKCELLTPSGRVVAEASATCDSYDRNVAHKDGKGMPPGNTVYQRAEKRAYVSATKQLFALSSKFYVEGEGAPGDEGQKETTGPEGGIPPPRTQKRTAASTTNEPEQDGLL
jgi:hypothetical protein